MDFSHYPTLDQLFKKLMLTLEPAEQEPIIKQITLEARPFLKNKQFSEALEIYEKIEEICPNYEPIRAPIKKLIDFLMKKKEKEFAENFIKAGLDKAKLFYKQKDYVSAIKLCEEILKYDELNRTAMSLEKKARLDFVKKNLADNKAKVKTLETRQQLAFYEQLYYVDPDYYPLQKYLHQCQEALKKEEIKKQQNFIANSLNRVKNFINEKDYRQAIKASREVLQIDSKNNFAKKLMAKAEKKDQKLIEQQLIEQMMENSKQFAMAYKTNKTPFVKI